MSFLIAVDDSLHNIKQMLEDQGYETVELTVADFRNVDAYVVDQDNKDLTMRKNTMADERVIAAKDSDGDMVIEILKKNLS